MRSLALATCLVPLVAVAQPPNSSCATAALLCAEQPQSGDNTGSTGMLPMICPNTGFQLWYTFFTNSVGGPVEVHLGALDCPQIVGMDDDLSVVVLAGDGTCNAAGFTQVSPCEQDNVGFPTTTQPLLPNTQYWVLVSGVLGPGLTITAQCSFNLQVHGPGADVIGVDFDAGPDEEIAEGGATQLGVTGGTNWSWSPTSGLSGDGIPDPIANPASTTAYSVSTVINGCTFIDTLVVNVIRLIDPPNTFSPNGDGINDTWEVPGIADYPGSEVLIYDRWGQKVFSSNGYREPWDGTNKGKAVSEGTYYYYIQLNQLEGKTDPYSGYISIIR